MPADDNTLERAVDRFEDAWQRGGRPAIEDFLPAECPERTAMLVELVHVDLERRLKAGEAVRCEAYLQRFPELAERCFTLDLVAAEYRLRRRREGNVSVEEYGNRFPQLREELTALLDGAPANIAHSRTVLLTLAPGAASGTPVRPDSPVVTSTRYRVSHVHARGGLGEIHVAHDEVLHREVALKLLQPERCQERDSRSRFLREAEITSQLEHPGIVPVYGLGQSGDGSPVYAMRFIRGQTFQEAIQRFHEAHTPGRGLAFQQLLRRFLSVCNTIAYAHSRGVLHRDVKPSNILLGEYGETIVVDWGLAKPFGAATAHEDSERGARADNPSHGEEQTQDGAIVGTPAFMSPEQAACDAAQVGPASDIYSLGATLYVLLTGQPPFQERQLHEVLVKVRDGNFPPPRQLNRHVPVALSAVCLKAMARRPQDRYATALDLAGDLEHWLADEPVSAWREPLTAKVRRRVTRHFTFVLVAGVALVAAAVLAGIWSWLTAARELAEFRSAEAGRELERADRESYFYRIGRASRDWLSNQGGLALQRLDECKPELRHWEWFHLKRCCQAALLTLHGHEAEVWATAFSPDGTRLASASLDHTVKVWDATTGRLLFTLDGHTGPVWAVAFSPNGQRLATGGDDGTVRLWDATTGQELSVLQRGAGEVMSCCFSDDGRRLAVATAPGRADNQARAGVVKVWSVATGQEVFTLADHKAGVYGVAYSRDGQHIASCDLDGTVILWDAHTGERLRTIASNHASFYMVAFSPDGRRLASTSRDGTVRVWDVPTGKAQHILYGHGNQVWGVAFSPDGKRLASSSDDTSIKVWDVALGRLLFTLRGHTRGIASVTWSPDGQRLASASDDQTARIWDATESKSIATLCAHTSKVRSVAFRPDGRLLASAGDDRTVKVWDVATRQCLFSLPCAGNCVAAAFSPDGKRLAGACDDQTVRIWNAVMGNEQQVLHGHTAEVEAVAFSPDGMYMASASRDKEVRIWGLSTGKPLHVLRGHSDVVRGVAFSPNGRQLASAGDDKTVMLWDTTTGELQHTFVGHSSAVLGVAFAPDGTTLAACTAGIERVLIREPGEIKLWNLRTGEETLTLQGNFRAVGSVAFSPDGKRLASGGADRSVRLWEPVKGQEILALYGHLNAVTSVAFSPDGGLLASGSFDGNVILWNGTPLAGD
jgi:WD40 repeat protein/tRNA A-37 threonylcarbamoyl transferase component Bud32